MSDIANRIAALPPEKRALLARQLKTQGAAARPPLTALPPGEPVFPLSFAQERQWFLHQWAPGSPLYHIAYAVRMAGALDVERLRRALAALVQRHETLRTSFREIDGQPRQIVAPQGHIPLEQHDLGGADAQALQAHLSERARRPFDLERGPLARVHLVRLGPSEHVLLFVAHHMVFDGWSSGVLIREIGALMAGGQPAAPLPVQYADFAVWQRDWLQGAALERHLSYWRQQLAGPPPALQLPTDRPYPPVEVTDGARCSARLDPRLGADLQRLSRAEGCTLFMVLLAAWNILLFRYTRQTDLLVGTPIAGRSEAQTEPLIGYFANTLVLRTDLAGDPSFRTLLQRVRATTLAAYEHEDAPFEKVVEILQPERNLSHSPLFQVMFVLQSDPINTLSSADLTVTPLEVSTQTSKFALTLEVSQRGQDLDLALEYQTGLFERPSAERILGHYQVLLRSLAANPAERIGALELLTAAERRRLLRIAAPAAPPAAPPQLLPPLVEAHAARRPDAVAVSYEGQELRYGELERRANQLAWHLRASGVGPDTLVGMLMRPCLEMIVGILGVLKAGGAYLPLDPANPAERLSFVLGDARPRTLLTAASPGEPDPAAGLLPPDGSAAGWSALDLRRDQARLAGLPDTPPPPLGGPHNLAYVIYTSGSTGRPKGVQVTHANVHRLLTQTEAWLRFSSDDVWVMFHSYAFDFSVWEIWGALLYGGRLVLAPHLTTRDPRAFYRLLVEQRVTVLNQTPSAFRQLDQAEREDGPDPRLALRLVIFGGEALSPHQLRGWYERHSDTAPQLVNMYGITETTVHVTYRPVTRDDAHRAPGSMIGRPIPDLQLYVLDPQARLVPFGVAGELYVGGPGLARGYLGRPALTAERFVPNPFAERYSDTALERLSDLDDDRSTVLPLYRSSARLYRSGDLARVRPDGDIEYLGRIDTQVKIRGFRIELGEIEAALQDHPAVRSAVAAVRQDAEGDRRLVAYVVPAGAETDSAPLAAVLRAYLKERLPEHMLPGALVVLAELPITGNGKVDYRALPSEVERSGARAGLAAPRGPTEERLAAIWSDVLGGAPVGRDDHFFELGGHSLLATRMLTRVREQLQVQVTLRDFFISPVLADLAALIDRAAGQSGPGAPPLLPADRAADLPLSFAQQRIWFYAQLNPDSPVYNVPAIYQIGGRLDPDLLARCLSALVARHEALRTTFHSTRGAAVQRIGPPQRLELPLVALEDTPADRRDDTLERYAAAEVRRPFDLTRDLLLRALLLRRAEDAHVLVLTVHHIAFDEWSNSVLLRELAELYRRGAAGQPLELPAPALHYADFAVWQRRWVESDGLAAQLAYWRRQLAPPLPVLQLPTDLPRPSIQTFRGGHEEVRIEQDLYRALDRFARAAGATLFMGLLAGWAAVLHRYSGQEDLLIGTPVANRPRSELESLIGFFANTLALRTDLRGEVSFRGLLGRIRETALEAFAHQDLPFDQLVGALLPERDPSRSPLFQTMLVLQNVGDRALSLPGLTIAPLALETGTTHFELAVVLVDSGGQIDGWLSYNTDLFHQRTAVRLLQHFLRLLERGLAEPDRPITHLALTTPEEELLLLGGWDDQTEEAYRFDEAAPEGPASPPRSLPWLS
jgi:amino acid adenylation domain-containing protein